MTACKDLIFFLLVSLIGLVKVDAGGLWSSAPAEYSDVVRQAYAVGNGRLGGEYKASSTMGKEALMHCSDAVWRSWEGETKLECGFLVVWWTF